MGHLDGPPGRFRSGGDCRAAALLLAAAAALGLSMPAALGAVVDPRRIFEAAEAVRSPDLNFAVDLTIHTSDPNSAWKERTGRYTMIARGKDYSLILIRDPRQFYPGTLLIMRGLYWMLLPRSEKPLQLSEQQVLDGDVSYGDLARGNLSRAFEPTLDGEETVRGDACFRLELKRTSYEASYPRIRCWVTQRKTRPRKFEYYGKTGALLKTVYYEDYRKGPLGVRAMRIEVETAARPHEATTLTFSDIRPLDASRLSFDVPGLIAFRNAALHVLEASGRQARPEELAARLGESRP